MRAASQHSPLRRTGRGWGTRNAFQEKPEMLQEEEEENGDRGKGGNDA